MDVESKKEADITEIKILVVDDSPTELNLMAESFITQGYQVIFAVNGEEALQKAESEQPALIVLDVVMPKLNGFQVCHMLRSTKNFKDTPIILLTSKKTARDKYYGLKQGANAYMTKPFTSEELLATASKLL